MSNVSTYYLFGGPFPLDGCRWLTHILPRGSCLPLLRAAELPVCRVAPLPFLNSKTPLLRFSVPWQEDAPGSRLIPLGSSTTLRNALLPSVSDTQCVPFPETVCTRTSDPRALTQRSYQWVGNSGTSRGDLLRQGALWHL